jgi:hypothetical protein
MPYWTWTAARPLELFGDWTHYGRPLQSNGNIWRLAAMDDNISILKMTSNNKNNQHHRIMPWQPRTSMEASTKAPLVWKKRVRLWQMTHPSDLTRRRMATTTATAHMTTKSTTPWQPWLIAKHLCGSFYNTSVEDRTPTDNTFLIWLCRRLWQGGEKWSSKTEAILILVP